jgi:branched-chain amino acid transport system substrate-binding protein
MKSGKLFCCLALIFVLSTMLFTGSWAAEPAKKTKTGVLKIGTATSLTGPAAAWGIPEAEMASMYADILNKDGGVTIGDTTYKINLIVTDDKFSPEGIKAAADRLINTEKVNAVVGGWTPAVTTIFGRECTTANIPLIHVVRELPGIEVVTPKYPVMFDLGWPQIQGLKVLIPRLKSGALPNVKTIALMSKDDMLGRTMMDLIKGLKEEWQKQYGLEIVYDGMFPVPAQDMTPWLSKIAALPKKADLIFAISTIPANLAMIAKQGYEMGLKVPIVTVPPLTDVGEFNKIAGYDGAQYVYTTGCAPWDFPKTSAKYKEMANRVRAVWKEKHGADMTFGEGMAWIANHLAAYLSAAKTANSIKTDDVVRALATQPIEHFYGTSIASGEKTYGIKRMLTFEGAISKIVGNQQKPVAFFGEPIP